MVEIRDPGKKPLYRYRIYGLVLASNYPFTNLVPVASGSPDVTFSLVHTSPFVEEWQNRVPLSSTQNETEDRDHTLPLYRMEGFDVVRLAGSVDFYIWPEKIVAHLIDPGYDHMIEIQLLGWILSVWLELHHVRAIHASAVVTKYGAIGFISSSKGGKSTLAAEFVKAGYPLLTDDILPVEKRSGNTYFARPGYPQMRMWPDEALYFLGRFEELELVHPDYLKRRVPIGLHSFGSFCRDTQPLNVLYLPGRRNGDIATRIASISPKDALIELVQHSFSPRTVAALGLEAERMKFFAGMVMHVPVRRLHYPSGYRYLGGVREALEKDMESL